MPETIAFPPRLPKIPAQAPGAREGRTIREETNLGLKGKPRAVLDPLGRIYDEPISHGDAAQYLHPVVKPGAGKDTPQNRPLVPDQINRRAALVGHDHRAVDQDAGNVVALGKAERNETRAAISGRMRRSLSRMRTFTRD